MTMDVQNNYQTYKEPSLDCKETNLNIESARTSHIKSEMQPTILNQAKTSKRSFDVAFLMMPDEKVRSKPPERQLRVSKQLFHNEEWEQVPPKRIAEMYKHSDYSNENTMDLKDQDDDRICVNNNISPTFGSDINIDVGTDEYPSKTMYCSDSENSERSRSRPNSNESAVRQPKFLPEYKNKIFDDPTLISMQSRARYERYSDKSDMSPKSAFTKVSNFATRSPNPSVSPDNLLYQNSVSPPLSAASPPTTSFNKSPGFNSLLTPAHILNSSNFFKGQNVPSSSPNYPDSAMQQRPASFNKGMEYQDKQDSKLTHMSPNKINFLPFRPEIPYLQAGSSYPFSVQNFQPPNSDFMKFPVPSRDPPVNPLIANPAAALLSTLLPPTLAAFTLPSQNVCAKCSISFRMTSDLVYHMRTHHKSESAVDPHRRKREEKLKCPVCNESFRERHHLTRHMTAHQNKEGDLDEVPVASNYNKKNKQFYPHNGSSLLHK